MKAYENKDYKKALEIFTKSCDSKILEGCFNLGVMYENE